MRTILIIDSQPEIVHDLQEILSLSNYTVVVAADGRQGIQMAVSGRPALILCGVRLPAIDGYGVVHVLQQHAETRSIPVIILTSKTEKDEFRKAMAAGADDFLTQPFDGTELLRSVEACLEKRRRRTVDHQEGIATIPRPQEEGGEPLLWRPADAEACPFRRRSILYIEGQRPTHVWYIESGKVKTYLIHTDGKELITRIYGPGECVGYIAAIRGGVFTDNAQVLEEASLVVMPRREFLDLLATDAALSRQIIGLLAKSATDQEAGLLNLAYSSLRKKVANGILSLHDNYSNDGEGKTYISISRENLAAIIGSAPESLTRTLSEFRKEKLIDISDGRIYLLNEDKLRKMIN